MALKKHAFKCKAD